VPPPEPPVSVLEAALEYARAGAAVLPCEPSTKEPIGSLVPQDRDNGRGPVAGTGGVKKATQDPAKIAEWWACRPDAMIGIATGSASGFFVIDPDVPKRPRHGQPGEMTADGGASWEALVESNGCPDTYVVDTPSGGRHYYFKYDPARPVGVKTGRLPPGIDVRGDGGYVCAPPSRCTVMPPVDTAWVPGKAWLPGKAYASNRPFDRATIAEAPDWLYSLLNGKRVAVRRAKASKSATETPVEAKVAKPGTIAAYDDDAADAFPYSPESAKFLWSLLIAIPADRRDLWLCIGAALHSLDDSWEHRRRGLWDAWSTRSSKFDPEDQEKTWEGFDRDRDDGVTWRTIRFEAIEAGWRPARPQATRLRRRRRNRKSLSEETATSYSRHIPKTQGSPFSVSALSCASTNFRPKRKSPAFPALARN